MTIMPPYRNILLYGIESFICSLCLNNEIVIEIKLILLLKKVRKTNAITNIGYCSAERYKCHPNEQYKY
jgi:hypothetical protein